MGKFFGQECPTDYLTKKRSGLPWRASLSEPKSAGYACYIHSALQPQVALNISCFSLLLGAFSSLFIAKKEKKTHIKKNIKYSKTLTLPLS
ncbi:MAG: hypothetical protein MJ231_06605 [bacterium]|nr:hypothetical protein [bacterium]